jgi:DNA-binding MarR family transcriptional regulator
MDFAAYPCPGRAEQAKKVNGIPVDKCRYNKYSVPMNGKRKDEIKQTKPFGSAAEEAFLNLQRTSAALNREFEGLLKPLGLTSTQYNVLRILRGAGSTGLLCRQLGERMITPDPDITRLLDRLEKRKLISRTRDSKDRRAIFTRITGSGLLLLGKLDKPVDNFHRKRLAHLDKSSIQSLIRLLEAARTSG